MLDKKSLPFLTRDMLAFESGVAFSLRVTTQSDTAATLTVRGMTSEGVFTLKHTTTADGLAATSTFRIPDLPIMVTVIDATGSFEQGQCFVSLSLVANDDILYQLASGLVYRQKAISYPQAPSQDIRPGGGALEYNASTDPAAGANASISVPTTEYWLILRAQVTLVTDATVANRYMNITFGSYAANFNTLHGYNSQAAGATYIYEMLPRGELYDILVPANQSIGLPYPMWVPGGKSISTSVTNLQAGDNLSSLKLYVEKFFTGSNP